MKVGIFVVFASLLFVSCTSNGMNTFGNPIAGGQIGGLAGVSGSGGSTGSGTLTGSVQGGLSPVAGASVNLMAAGSDTPVATATTASDGSFSFDFTKPATPSLLYVLVTGGNAGGASNKNLELASLIGSSDKVPSSTEVNELTTAAFSEVMFDFGLEKTSKGSVTFAAPAGSSGIANLVSEWKNLIASNGKLAAAALPKNHQDALAIIANAAASCVQTPSSCDALFGAASNSGGSAAGNLLEAVANMLTVNADLVGVDKIAEPLASGTGFLLNSKTPPGTLNIPLPASTSSISAGSEPLAVAVDSKGTIWITGKSGLTKIPANGKGASTYNIGAAAGLAIDSQGNIWTTSANHLVEVSASGKPVGSFSVGTDPKGVAIDASGNLWVANPTSGDVTVLNGSGSSVGRFSVSGAPAAVVIDSKGNAWIVNNSEAGTLSELTSSGGTVAAVNVGKNPRSAVIDSSGNLWVTNFGSDSVTKLSPKGAILGSYPVTAPEGVVVDADGQIWLTNAIKNGTVTEIDSSTNVSIGTYPVGNLPAGLAIDPSGNLWVANSAGDKVTKINKVAGGPSAFPYQGPQFPSSSF